MIKRDSKGRFAKGNKNSLLSNKKQSKTKKKLFKEGKLTVWHKGTKGLMKSNKNSFTKGHKINLGKKHSPKTRNKMSETKKRLYKEGKLIPYWKGKKFPEKHQSKETKRKISKKLKELFQDSKYVKEFYKKFDIKPNKPEKLLINLFKQLNLPYKYVGNFKFWIEGRNPDFINYNGQKKIIEFFGDYWHSDKHLLKKCGITKEENIKQTKEHYAKYGYDTLIIWEHELKNNIQQVIDKIQQFDNPIMN